MRRADSWVLAFLTMMGATTVSSQSMGPRPAEGLVSFDRHAVGDAANFTLGVIDSLRLPPLTKKRQESDPRRELIGSGRMFDAEGIAPGPVTWRKQGGDQVYSISVASPGAQQVRTGIRVRSASAAAQIWVAPGVDPAYMQMVNPDQLRAAVGSVLWTPPTAGEEQVVHLVGGPEALDAEIVGVSHIFSGAGDYRTKALGDALSCQIDVACISNSSQIDAATRTAFNAKVNSTARMVITNAAGQTSACTGTLLNNDYRVVLFLSAEHCVGSRDEANSLVTDWGYQAATCGGFAPASFTRRTGGATIMAMRGELDQTLLGLRDVPPAGAVLSGWSASTSSRAGELMLGMHHPRGDLKKASLGTITGISGAFSVGGTNYPASGFYTTSWQIGLVEPGSSGSGIFIQPPGADYLALVGVLNSGPANPTCSGAASYTNRYGRLSSFFPYAQRFLQSDYSINYSDLWWNPSESGWGINLQHQGEIIFATWFTYDTDGTGMWLVMSNGEKIGANTFQGALYRARGTPFNLINGVQAVELPLPAVGTGTLSFSGSNSGTFSYVVNGISGAKQIERQVFGARPTCEFNLASRNAATNYQDLWWNPDESGWGVNIAHQGDTLFATWFTYDQSRAGMWLVMSNGVRTGPSSYRGDLYRTTGTPFNRINGTTSVNLPLVPVGTLSFNFSDGANGSMGYTVNGISGTKPIRRQVFSSPTTLCRP